MDFRSHLHALWAVRRLVALTSLVVAALFVLWAAVNPVTVVARATLNIRQPTSDGGTTAEDLNRQDQRYVVLSQTRAVRSAAAAEAGGGVDEGTIARQVAVTPSSTGLLQVVSTGAGTDRPEDQVRGVSTALIAAVEDEQDRNRLADIASLEARLSDVTERLEQLRGTDARARATRDALTAQAQSLVAAIADRSNQLSGGLSALGDVQVSRPGRGLVQTGLVSLIVTALIAGEVLVASFRARGRLVPGSEVSTVEFLTGAPVISRIYRTPDGNLSPDDAAHLFLSLASLQGTTPASLTFVSLTPAPSADAVARVVSTVAAELDTRTLLVEVDAGMGSRKRGQAAAGRPGAVPAAKGEALVTRTLVDLGSPVAGPASSGRRSLRPLLEQGLVVTGAPAYNNVTDVLYVARELGGVVLLADARRVAPDTLRDAGELLRRADAPPFATALFHVDSRRTIVPRVASTQSPAISEEAMR